MPGNYSTGIYTCQPDATRVATRPDPRYIQPRQQRTPVKTIKTAINARSTKAAQRALSQVGVK